MNLTQKRVDGSIFLCVGFIINNLEIFFYNAFLP